MYFPLFKKYCCGPNILRNCFRPSTRIFYPIKRAKFSHPDWLKLTLIICDLPSDYKSDKSITWFISLSYAYLRNGHELLQSSSSTPSLKVLIKLLGRQSCFPRPNQGLFHPQGHPTTIFGKISVQKSIWDLEFSQHLL